MLTDSDRQSRHCVGLLQSRFPFPSAGWRAVAVSAAIALTYYDLMLCGHLLRRTYPNLVRRYFAI
jgi:hypothetical protein